MNNPLSYSSIKLDLFSKEGALLKSASGFVVENEKQYNLITNWHVLSGKDIITQDLHEPVIEQPHSLQTSIHIIGGEGENKFPLSWGTWKRLTIQLYDDGNMPKWIECRVNKQNHPVIDIVALPIQLDLNFANLVSRNVLQGNSGTYFWSKISAIPISAIDTDVEYCPPDTVYTIGYPLDWAPQGTEKPGPAYWRTSSIASEIDKVSSSQEDLFFIDPRALEGMSGSPVVGMKNDRIKLLGVYSNSSNVGFSANAGLVWSASFIKRLIGTS